MLRVANVLGSSQSCALCNCSGGGSLPHIRRPQELSKDLGKHETNECLPRAAGGSAAQSELIHQRIRHLAQQAKVPVFTFAEDVAASGGCSMQLPCTLWGCCNALLVLSLIMHALAVMHAGLRAHAWAFKNPRLLAAAGTG